MALAVGLLKTLLELGRAKKSGAVDAMGPGTRVRFLVEEGTIISADEGNIGETLGRILLREHIVTPPDYASALERTAALRTAGKPARLGDVLVEMGKLTTEQLETALAAQVREKVVRALGWTSARYAFFECFGPIELVGRYPTPLEPLILDALRDCEPSRVSELLSSALMKFPELRAELKTQSPDDVSPGLAAFEMRSAEEAFARSIDGTRTVGELLLNPAPIDTSIVLATLLLTESLELRAAARPGERPAPVAVPRKVGAVRVVKKAGVAKSPLITSTPNRSIRPPSMVQVQQIHRVATRLRVARDAKRSVAPPKKEVAWQPEAETIANVRASRSTLPDPKSPGESSGKLRAALPPELPKKKANPPSSPRERVAAPAEPNAARLLAEKAFQAGKQFVRANDMEQAAVELRRAASLFDATEFKLWATWATMRSTPSTEREFVADLRRLADAAIAEDGRLAFAYFVLGHLALRDGDAARGRELFERARALDAETVDDAVDVRLRAAPGAEDRTKGEIRALGPLVGAVAPAPSPGASVVPRPQPEGTGTRLSSPPPSRTPSIIPRPAASIIDLPSEEMAPPTPTPRRALPPPLPPPETPMALARAIELSPPPAQAPADEVIADAAEIESIEDAGGASDGDGEGEGDEIGAASRTTRTTIARPKRVWQVAAFAIGTAATLLLWNYSLRSTGTSPSMTRTEVRAPVAPPAIAAPSPAGTAAPEIARAKAAPEAATAAPVAATDAPEIAMRDAGGALTPPPPGEDVTATDGALDFPKAAAGHRVFVDGKLIGEPPAPIVVRCGHHKVKVGSAGKERDIEVACGGRSDVPYP